MHFRVPVFGATDNVFKSSPLWMDNKLNDGSPGKKPISLYVNGQIQ